MASESNAKSIFEKSRKGQRAYSLPKSDSEFDRFQPASDLLRKTEIPLPEVSELDLMRHFSSLAKKTIGIDTHFYPLGSCTMKYNPRVNEQVASMPGFSKCHPLAPDETVQGNLEVADNLIRGLCELSGMTAGTLAPNAGAQGELTGVLMIRAYHRKRGDFHRTEMLIPDNAHGTNPATAAMAGFKIVSLKTDSQGNLDPDHLQEAISERTAGLMMTNPNTLGLFDVNIAKASALLHKHGALLYYDGANLNAIMNIVKPGEMGFDVMHLNLHKTFSTPHGGGGPGSAPVLCNEKLAPFLPVPRIVYKDGKYTTSSDFPDSIGRISTFQGNFAVCVRAYMYYLLHGNYGLRSVSEAAVLNANYLKKKISAIVTIPFPRFCMHEFVISTEKYLADGIKAYDIAKRILDYGCHSPTVYFPLIVKECMLIEPTETESKEMLDEFAGILENIVGEIKSDPDILRGAPHTLSVARLDEARAVKCPIFRHSAANENPSIQGEFYE